MTRTATPAAAARTPAARCLDFAIRTGSV